MATAKEKAPSEATIAKHVEIGKKLAAKNAGLLPACSWFDTKKGKKYWRTYDVLRAHTRNFAGIPREFRNGHGKKHGKRAGRRAKAHAG